MKVYKCVDEATQQGKILSAGIWGKHETEYVPGEWKHLPNMFVFETLEDAENAAIGTHIWVCETTYTYPAPEKILFAIALDQDFEKFWENPEGYMGVFTFSTPAGSLLCDSLLLLERVEEDDE